MSVSVKESSDLSNADTANFDFSGLSDSVPDTESTDRTTDEKICPTCDLPIVREPGSRGRLPKYHPDCKPSAGERIRSTSVGNRSVVSARARSEADQIVIMVRKQMIRGTMFVMMADQYDGFVLMSTIPSFCESLRGVLERYTKLRKELLAIKTGGSIIGLAFTVLMPVAAVLAHHGLIPFARLSDILVNLPKIMFKVSQRMKEGEKATEEMMQRIGEEFLKTEKAAPNGNSNGSVPASNFD